MASLRLLSCTVGSLGCGEEAHADGSDVSEGTRSLRSPSWPAAMWHASRQARAPVFATCGHLV